MVDVETNTGGVETIHTNNSGSMKSCLVPGAEILMSKTNNPNRKTKYTWEMINISGSYVGVNTSLPNVLVYNLLKQGYFGNYSIVKREVSVGDSRIDLYAENENEKFFIEVKNVTLKQDDFALFPDAVTKRGAKHLHELTELKKEGYRVANVYVIQRLDVELFAPAKEIDCEYAKVMIDARNAGVEIIPIQVKHTGHEVLFHKELPLVLD